MSKDKQKSSFEFGFGPFIVRASGINAVIIAGALSALALILAFQ